MVSSAAFVLSLSLTFKLGLWKIAILVDFLLDERYEWEKCVQLKSGGERRKIYSDNMTSTHSVRIMIIAKSELGLEDVTSTAAGLVKLERMVWGQVWKLLERIGMPNKSLQGTG